jgi:hypothetical protein
MHGLVTPTLTLHQGGGNNVGLPLPANRICLTSSLISAAE